MKTINMKAIVATGYGSPAVLQLQNVAKPFAGNNEVLVKIYATTATTADGMMRTGKPYFGRLMTGLLKPKHPIPGTGFSGVVEATGDQVTAFKTGDRVFGETTLGFSTNAEYVSVPETGVILTMPDNMSFAEAAAYCDGHLTSFSFLKEVAKIKPGQSVLINGASGSLGTAAVQLAKYLGAEVVGVTSTKNTGLVKSLGADMVLDYTKVDFTEIRRKFDVVFDTVGKSSFKKSRKVLKEGGVYVSPVLKLSLLLQMLKTSISGKQKAKFSASGMKKDHELKTLLSELSEIFRDGKLKTVIDRQFPLEKVAMAHEYIAKGHKRGNVIIMVQS
ncbi:NAD(P)-dependent alcohol dehydrogenase [Saccharicrinis sp. FJH54]|uniref:NAD(P)-dependent alcohol dehydrogenase n=1 Tax=Saccharicrinis sp. FJH54 TaxID=3344665 RepID=UPI0035D4DCA3